MSKPRSASMDTTRADAEAAPGAVVTGALLAAAGFVEVLVFTALRVAALLVG